MDNNENNNSNNNLNNDPNNNPNNENSHNNEFDLSNINSINMDQISDNEFLFSIPIYNHLNLYESIQNILENITSNNIITNNFFNNNENESMQINIEFDIYDDYDENISEDSTNYFKNCKEINDLICKPIKIKNNDPLLEESCLICYDKYKTGEYKRILPKCNHFFHKKCVDKWLKKNSTCPICRDELLNDLN